MFILPLFVPFVCALLAGCAGPSRAAALPRHDADARLVHSDRAADARNTLFHHTSSNPYDGAHDFVLIGDTRFGAPAKRAPRQRFAAYANIHALRSEWDDRPQVLRDTWYVNEKLRYDLVRNAIVGEGRGDRTQGYDARRKYLDCRNDAVQLAIRFEAQRIAAGRFDAVFCDNVRLNTFSGGSAAALAKFDDADYRASLAAGLDALSAEFARLGVSPLIVVNLADPWNWTEDGRPLNWQKAWPRVADLLWEHGVRGVMFELPEKRDPGSAEGQTYFALGKAWLGRGGELFLIFENDERAAPYRAALLGKNTYSWLRPAGK